MEIAALPAAARPPSRRKALLGIGALLLGKTCRAAAVRPKLKMAVINLMPWAMMSPNGKYSGIFIDAAIQLSELSGVDLDIVLLPYARALLMLENGSVDLMFALECDRVSDISCRLAPVASEDVVIVGRHGMHLKTMSDLYGKTVGHLRYADYDAEFTAATKIVKYETNSYIQCLQMMRMGRLDAVISVRTALRFALKSLGMGTESLGTTLFLRHTLVSLYASKNCANSFAITRLKQACDILREHQTVKSLENQLNK